ncbi:ATP-binding protein [Ruminococcus sp. 5_1_39BFAA]|uniref:ATP-binding protein n=1 Tax=Ruminococcus sp. 5_1_39BFAA TaxID=457412 RepID=UPI00356955A9
MAITVPRASREQRPVYINGDIFKGTFRRNWEGDYHCTPSEIRAMLRDQTEQTMDMKILEDWSISDLNQESVQAYRNLHRSWKPGHVWEMLENEEYLKNIGAAARSKIDGKIHPTAAGMLMFGNEYDIVREFPEYFLDYRENLDPTIRWTDRLQSSSGEWSGNVFDFYFRVYNKIIKDVKVPFKMVGGVRIDDTPVHKALREALANCLVNTDFYVPRGVVIKKENDLLIFENPGYIRTGKEQMRKGGESDPRNKGLMKMFNLVNIGERAGSGVPDIFNTWEQEEWVEPIIEERYGDASRTSLTLSFVKKQAKKTSEKNKRNKTSEIKQAKKTLQNKEKIGAFLEYNGASKTSEIAKMLGLSEARTRALLKEMVLEGSITASGGTKKKIYFLQE